MSATKKVRSAAIFIDSKRQATMQQVTYTLNTNDTQEVADSGVYVAEGQALSKIQSNNIVPVAGTTTKLLKKALQKQSFTIVLFPVDGDYLTLEDCRVESLEFTSETQSGKQTGNFSFFAAEPEVRG